MGNADLYHQPQLSKSRSPVVVSFLFIPVPYSFGDLKGDTHLENYPCTHNILRAWCSLSLGTFEPKYQIDEFPMLG